MNSTQNKQDALKLAQLVTLDDLKKLQYGDYFENRMFTATFMLLKGLHTVASEINQLDL